ncbi:Hypothetical predicted protein [Pelobates cultripes]|uniref:Uncharacterized protein n=1 Tax=Pelobates cultripes TaxID=61616 RepID=A0AAD1RQK3_PELCU|nr:Hypothetical predicted protein [Pelobates cultripes]
MTRPLKQRLRLRPAKLIHNPSDEPKMVEATHNSTKNGVHESCPPTSTTTNLDQRTNRSDTHKD